MTRFRYALIPGRHHLLTRFQGAYLPSLLAGLEFDSDGTPLEFTADAQVVWVVTSSNHRGTRRNPVSFNRREAMIERFDVLSGVPSLVVGVTDVAPTGRFAEVCLTAIEHDLGVEITPENALVVCSTPEVVAMYQHLGYKIALAELDGGDPDPGGARARPWDVLTELVEMSQKEGAATRDQWRERAHPATLSVYDRYGLAEEICTIFDDPMVGDEGGLTETRSYRSYIKSFEDASERKWAQARDFVEPGRIVDVGCATGAMLERAAAEERLRESDLFGIEVSRTMFEVCEHKKAEGVFENPNTYFYQRNILTGKVFPDRSIHTTLSFALTHEIYSYGQKRASIDAFVKTVFTHTAPGGVWLNSDVLGPESPHTRIRFTFSTPARTPAVELQVLDPAQRGEYLKGLGAGCRFLQFAKDFSQAVGREFEYTLAADGSSVETTLANITEFVSKATYTDNWLSEVHEEFAPISYSDWEEILTEAGFATDKSSHAWRNEWVVENLYNQLGSLSLPTGEPLAWPDTHVLLVARRPLNS